MKRLDKSEEGAVQWKDLGKGQLRVMAHNEAGPSEWCEALEAARAILEDVPDDAVDLPDGAEDWQCPEARSGAGPLLDGRRLSCGRPEIPRRASRGGPTLSQMRRPEPQSRHTTLS